MKQGKVGNCYFMSSLASVTSRNPRAIDDIFIFEQNKANYYLVKLFIDG